jgi:hypothetical protein
MNSSTEDPLGDLPPELVEVADLLWLAAHGAPPLDEDPTAIMLGLVSNPDCVLDPKALRKAREDSGLTASDLADQLTARGWYVQIGDVVCWESKPLEIIPAIIAAIADETDTEPQRLIYTSKPSAGTTFDRWEIAP